MKKLSVLLLAVLFYGAIAAQDITVSGGCMTGTSTLMQGTNPATVNGKPYYTGYDVMNTETGPESVAISIVWSSVANEWELRYDGQPYFFSPANTSRPPGTASTAFSWETAAAAPCGSPGTLSVTGNVVLWVTFGSVDAHVKGNNLYVNWSTEKEVNNDHFEIEASTDGEQFTTVGNVPSKAENGNSDVTLKYEWTGNAGMHLAMLSYFALALIIILSAYRKKTVRLAAVIIVSFIAFTQGGCKKDKNNIADTENYYIRIAQIDKDGTKTYSKVVRVNGD